MGGTRRSEGAHENVGGGGVLGEERGAELERGLELARVNGVPDRPHPALRDPAGEPELAGHVQPAHSRSRVRVLGGRREVEEGEKAGTARRGRVYRVGMCDGGDPMWARPRKERGMVGSGPSVAGWTVEVCQPCDQGGRCRVPVTLSWGVWSSGPLSFG
jgi:hypothetical protein